MEKITIKGQEFNVKYSIRALMIFEHLTGKSFELTSLTDTYILYYSMLLAANPDSFIDFEQFLDAIDEDISVSTQLQSYLAAKMKFDSQFTNQETEEGEKK